jgi:mono/diheme cytochrome c family protein
MKRIIINGVVGLSLVAGVLSTGISAAEDIKGEMLYTSKCKLCHGVKGDGKGGAAAYLGYNPANFTDPRFWKEHDDKKIALTIENGQDEMPAFKLKPEEIKDLIDYLHTFNKPAK